MAGRRPLLAAVAAGAALMLGACGLGPGEPRAGAVELHVTRDFGQRLIGEARRDRIAPRETVMGLLQSERQVRTAYGGGFVESIDGLAGRGAGGRDDWFYFVNGLEGATGAADRRLQPGDVVQWDYRRWEGAMSVPAIVGAFPEPLRSGVGGQRLPVRLECGSERSRACVEARRRLGAVGVNAPLAALGDPGGGEVIRVIVAPWSQARQGAAAAKVAEGPRASGVFARFSESGRLELLDAAARPARTAPAGTGLVAATVVEGGQRVWLVTGNDEAGTERAAAALERAKLRDRYAVAAEPGGVVALPVDAGEER